MQLNVYIFLNIIHYHVSIKEFFDRSLVKKEYAQDPENIKNATKTEKKRVLIARLIFGKPYSLIIENFARTFKKILSLNYLILKVTSFLNYKVGSNSEKVKIPCKIKISHVKKIVRSLFGRNLIHGVQFIVFSCRILWNCRYKRNIIIKGLYFEPIFCLTKNCLPGTTDAWINHFGIESVESTRDFNLKQKPLCV